MRTLWLAAVLVFCAACGGRKGASASSGTSSSDGSGTSAGATTGSSASSTGSSASSTGSSASSTGSSASSTGSSGSVGTTGSVAGSTATGGTSASSGGCGADGASCDLPHGEIGSCCGGICGEALTEDPANCGACGHACGDAQGCFRGVCQDFTCENSTVCALDAGPGVCCGPQQQTCVDTGSDPQNCGECENACGDGRICQFGSCVVTDCALPGTIGAYCHVGGVSGWCCERTCQALDSAANCGVCGQSCPVGAQCSATGTSCVSNTGSHVICSDDGGIGGPPCPAGTVCNGGACLTAPAACTGAAEGARCAVTGGNGTCCGGGCADIDSADAHCGACGVACASDQWCRGGQCEAAPTCGPGNSGTPCPLGDGGQGACCDDACANTQSSPSACGRCGRSCPDGERCQNGDCVAPDAGSISCDIIGCAPGSICFDHACVSFACAPGASGAACAFGLGTNSTAGVGTCCDGRCVDPSQDPANCGACGTSCPSGICAGNIFGGIPICFPAADAGERGCGIDGCAPGTICVDHVCVSAACSAGGLGAICAMSSGVRGFCCANFASATQCADLSADSNNCGGCGWRCPDGQNCVAGRCSGDSAGCGPGQHGSFCNLDGGAAAICCPSGCADLDTDAQNCGGCGNTCSGGLSCVGGACTALGCSSTTDHQQCVVDGGSGTCCSSACHDLDTDPENCGGCDNACPVSTTCRGGHCGLDSCDPAHVGATCHLGDDLGTCCGDGCVDTSTSSQNCGGCGLSCAVGQTCRASRCH